MNDEAHGNLSKAFCWTACEAFTWVAFRQAWKVGTGWELPEAQWSRPWKQWPQPWLDKALAELETGTPWQPHEDDWPPPDVDSTRAHARLLTEMRDESAGVLLNAWKADQTQQQRNQEAFLQAWRDVMEAVKDGRVTVWARPASRKGIPKLSAVHEQLGLQLFMGPRVIDPFGCLVFDERAGDWFDSVKYEGPWFDEARFSEAELRALWSAPDAAANALPSDQPTSAAAQLAPPAPHSANATYSDSALRGWFHLREATWSEGKALPSEKTDRADAAAYFETLPSRERFREIRKEKTPETWRKPGPRIGSK